jgi:hypothetical protein
MARHSGFKASEPGDKSHPPSIRDFQEYGETPLGQPVATDLSEDGAEEHALIRGHSLSNRLISINLLLSEAPPQGRFIRAGNRISASYVDQSNYF